MNNDKFERRSYTFDIRAEQTDEYGVIEGEAIVYNNANSTMRLMKDEFGLSVRVKLDTERNAEANAANWTSIGNVPAAYRPVSQTSITAQIYNGDSNEAAGGYIATSGWIVLWTNPKTATNNY